MFDILSNEFGDELYRFGSAGKDSDLDQMAYHPMGINHPIQSTESKPGSISVVASNLKGHNKCKGK